jgi:hypothetical protein
MRIVKLLLYGLFPCLLWSCEKEGTDQQYVEVPEGFALSAGTATNFLTSSKAYDFEASWLSGISTTEMDCMTMCVPVVTRMADWVPCMPVIPVEVVTGMPDVPSLPCGVKAVREITVFLPCWYISPERTERSSRTMGVCFMTRLFMG